MAQVFRKGSNSVARVTLIGLIGGFFGFWGVVYAVYRSPYTTDQNVPRVQRVPFSHEHHVAGLGLDCRYCHTGVENSSFAGIPPTHTCMTCHSQVWTEAPMLAPVRQSLATGKPLRWDRVNQLPDFVFFNHSIHVQKGIGCSTCHGQVDQMPLTWKAHSLYMRWCLDCHEAPEKFLRPKSEIYDMSWTPPQDQAERAKALVTEYHISKQRLAQLKDCSMCHR
ncbi:MAG TPA: cytochrome c3 family protein [Verrucomicrobiae bacterium]|nr:cytochrome c3 family protein [Verrucomicrobiae bacterium]